jgi:hypothetical protein
MVKLNFNNKATVFGSKTKNKINDKTAAEYETR